MVTATKDLTTLSDLRLWYYGGDSDAEHNYLEDAYFSGINAYDILAFVQAGGAGGSGLPVGGTTGQALTKKSNTDYDAQWQTISGAGSATVTYKWSTNITTNVDPGSGNLRVDNATPTSATVLAASVYDSSGTLVRLDTLQTGSQFWLYRSGDLTQSMKLQVRATPTNNSNSWYTIPITVIAIGTGGFTPSNNNDIQISSLTGSATPSPLPPGGTINQVLAKNSATDGDASWRSSGVPAGGAAGMLLSKATGIDYQFQWVNPFTLSYGSVTPETGWGQTPSNGSVTSVSRADHTHGTQANPVAYGTVMPETGYGYAATDGSLNTVSRSDHSHGSASRELPTAGTANQVLAKNTNTAYDVGWKTLNTAPPGGTQYQCLAKATNTDYDWGWQTTLGRPDTSQGGSVATSRYTGGTTSGPPTTGTYQAGDFMTDLNGFMWVCTTSGSPGTWQVTGTGKMLGYVELTSAPATFNGVGVANRADVIGFSLTVTIGVRPIELVCHCMSVNNNSASCGVTLGIYDSDTTTLLGQAVSSLFPTASINTICHPEVGYLAPSPGVHNYKISAWVNVGGVGTINAGPTNKPFFRIREL